MAITEEPGRSGIVGALIQGHIRNPLADPERLGVRAGAACAVVVSSCSFGITDTLGFVWFAFAGALVAPDMLARTMPGHIDLPVGTLTSAIGAPFLLDLRAVNTPKARL